MIVEKLADELRTEYLRHPDGDHVLTAWLAVARRAVELLGDKPPINVLVKDDGTWLEFHGDGKTSLIRLETLAEGPISRTALKAWCRDYRAGATATPILDVEADKPVATREAVEKWWHSVRNDYNGSPVVTTLIAALVHFAPPRTMIEGMTESEIGRAMRAEMPPDLGEWSVGDCARVAHRLANTPAPEHDPDAEAKSHAWDWYQMTAPVRQHTSPADWWKMLSEEQRQNCRRAVAAAKKEAGGE